MKDHHQSSIITYSVTQWRTGCTSCHRALPQSPAWEMIDWIVILFNRMNRKPLAGESVGVKDTSVAATIPPSFPLDAEVEELAIWKWFILVEYPFAHCTVIRSSIDTWWVMALPSGSGCLECSWTDWTEASGHRNWKSSPDVQPFLIIINVICNGWSQWLLNVIYNG